METIELSRWLWKMITVADREGDEFVKLVKLHCQVSALIGNLATKLRLTPQSSRDARIPKLVPVGPKPWELSTGQRFDDDEPRGFDATSPTSRRDHQPHRSVRLPQWGDRLAFRNCFVASLFVRAGKARFTLFNVLAHVSDRVIPISLKSDKGVFDLLVHRPTHQSRRHKVGSSQRLQRIAGIKNSKKKPTTAIAALVLAATAVVAEPLPVA